MSNYVVPKINQMQVIVPDYGKVWYYDNYIANISYLTNIFDKYRVTYDSYQYGSFPIHNKRGIIKFKTYKQGLYIFNPTYPTAKYNVFTTVEGNMVVFTSIQIERFKLSRKST